MCNGAHESSGPSPRTAWRNLRDSDLPVAQRVWRLAANSWWKVSHRQSCCGHYGEPGC